MSSQTSSTFESLHAAVDPRGFAFVEGAAMRAILEPFGPLTDWDAFADSWNRLELDTYMADGGRYRRRRHATFAAPAKGPITRKPHQPHYQSLDYNPLHGGIERWFEPVEEEFGAGSSLGGIAPEQVFCFATGNTARLRKLNCGLIECGRAADFVFLDRAQHTAGRTLLESVALGDIPGVGMVVIDGSVRCHRSRNTPPATEVPVVTTPH